MKNKRHTRSTNKTDRNSRRRIAAAAVLLAVSAGVMILSVKSPGFAQWYSDVIYPGLVSGPGRAAGALPFSLAELCMYAVLAVLMGSVLFLFWKIIREKGAGRRLFRWFSYVILAVAVLAFLYTAGCGINYHRNSFSESEGIVTADYTAEELKEICVWLTDEVNALSGSVQRDSEGVMELDAPEGEGAVEAMERLAKEFQSLEGYYPEPKKLVLSEFLSYQGLTGIYSPFTIEANYNGDMTAYNIPFTACHELSHLRGFMQEQEANFIAFLACTGSERADFRYSGYLSGWVYCMNALYRADNESWAEVRVLLDEKAEQDLAANHAFWDSYEGTISETADRVNDTYLKANGQADGVKSYNRMVDLIVAYFGDGQ